MRGAAERPLIFLVAGEPSGDALGGRLMAALKRATGGGVRFAGVGGDRMAAEGLDSLFPMAELSVMGYLEVVPRIPRLFARSRQIAARARALNPAALITIDSPEFTLRVARRLNGAGFPLVHYVAPQVWAHRPGRAPQIAHILDHLLALLPFEPAYFEAVGLACSFVGHPVVEEGADGGDGTAFRARHAIPERAPLVCLLPGSRPGEVSRLLPVYGATLARLSEGIPDLWSVVPTLRPVAEMVRRGVAEWPTSSAVVCEPEEKYDAFAASMVALAASGTVVLELAIAGLPAVVTYRVNPLTAWAARRMIRVPYVSLVNLILDRSVMPELLQERCRPDMLAEAVAGLVMDENARAAQSAEARRAAVKIGHGGPPPSERAAKIVLDLIAGRVETGAPT